MKVVLDTDVVVAAMRSPRGASAAILRAARQGRATLLVEHASGSGIRSGVLAGRSTVWPQGCLIVRFECFLTAVVAMAEPVTTHFLWRPQLRDPADEMVLEAAINGRADALVTFNVRDFGTVPAQFGVEVLLPREAIGRIKP